MQSCPHCNIEIRVRELPHQGFFASHRVCPHCDGLFIVDKDTQYRQAVFILIALISLLFTVLMYLRGMGWLVPSLLSYLFLAGLIYWGNRKLFFVPYEKDQRSNHDT